MLLIGVLIGRSGSDDNPTPAPIVQVDPGETTATTPGTTTPATPPPATGAVTTDWPTDAQGFTIQLSLVPKDGATQESVDAAKETGDLDRCKGRRGPGLRPLSQPHSRQLRRLLGDLHRSPARGCGARQARRRLSRRHRHRGPVGPQGDGDAGDRAGGSSGHRRGARGPARGRGSRELSSGRLDRVRASLKPRPRRPLSPAVAAAGTPAPNVPGPIPAELETRRARLQRDYAELQSDLGGLVYEMAIRDAYRLDVITRQAAKLQAVDAQLTEVERAIEALVQPPAAVPPPVPPSPAAPAPAPTPAPVPTPPAAPPTAPTQSLAASRCTACGRPLEAGAGFCGSCGAARARFPRPRASPPAYEAAAPPDRARRSGPTAGRRCDSPRCAGPLCR